MAYAKCTKMSKYEKKRKKIETDLSTQKIEKNTINSSFPQSYPHYPHYRAWKVWIIIVKKRTGVL